MTPRFLKARVGATVSALLATMLTAGLAYVTAAPAAAATTLTIDCSTNARVLQALGTGETVTLSFGANSNCSEFEAFPANTLSVSAGTNSSRSAYNVSRVSAASAWTADVYGTGWSSGTGQTYVRAYNTATSSYKYIYLFSASALANATLASLRINGSPLSGFASGTLNYTETVTASTNSLTIAVKPTIYELIGSSQAATVSATCTNGTGTSNITFGSPFNGEVSGSSCTLTQPGTTTIAITVTALDGQTSTYNLDVYRPAAAGGGGGGPSTYSVTYYAGMGTIGTPPTDATSYSSGQTATVLSSSVSKLGFSLAGWQVNGSGPALAAGQMFSISGSTTLFALWIAANSSSSSSAQARPVVPIRNDIPYVTANDVTKSADGGRVALKGEKLSEVKSITVGGKKVDTFTVNASGQLEFALPAGLTGEQDVQLTGKDSVLSFRVNATPTAAPAVTAPVVPVLTKVSTVARKGNAVQIAAAAWKGVTTQTHQLYVCSTQTWAGVGAAAPAGCIQTQTPASDASSFSVDLKPRWAGKYLVVVTTVANGAGTTTKSWSNGVRI